MSRGESGSTGSNIKQTQCVIVARWLQRPDAATGLNPTQRVHDINSPLIITGINSEQEEELLHPAAASPLLFPSSLAST